MTSYAPPSYLSCSSCGAAIEVQNMASGNTFGARYWTDGYRFAPMLPEQLPLIKCSSCSSLVWLDELAEFDGSELVDADASEHQKPSFDELYSYINSNPDLEPMREQYVRLRAWWTGNDSRRDEVASPLTEAERVNLLQLKELMTAEGSDQLMKAEIYRELGDFEAAQKQLLGDFGGDFTAAIELIKALSDDENAGVAELKP